MPLNAAVKQAVDDCILEGILEDFLRTNRAEVIAIGESRLSTLITQLLNDGKESEIQQVLTNPSFRKQMYDAKTAKKQPLPTAVFQRFPFIFSLSRP